MGWGGRLGKWGGGGRLGKWGGGGRLGKWGGGGRLGKWGGGGRLGKWGGGGRLGWGREVGVGEGGWVSGVGCVCVRGCVKEGVCGCVCERERGVWV